MVPRAVSAGGVALALAALAAPALAVRPAQDFEEGAHLATFSRHVQTTKRPADWEEMFSLAPTTQAPAQATPKKTPPPVAPKPKKTPPPVAPKPQKKPAEAAAEGDTGVTNKPLAIPVTTLSEERPVEAAVSKITDLKALEEQRKKDEDLLAKEDKELKQLEEAAKPTTAAPPDAKSSSQPATAEGTPAKGASAKGTPAKEASAEGTSPEVTDKAKGDTDKAKGDTAKGDTSAEGTSPAEATATESLTHPPTADTTPILNIQEDGKDMPIVAEESGGPLEEEEEALQAVEKKTKRFAKAPTPLQYCVTAAIWVTVAAIVYFLHSLKYEATRGVGTYLCCCLCFPFGGLAALFYPIDESAPKKLRELEWEAMSESDEDPAHQDKAENPFPLDRDNAMPQETAQPVEEAEVDAAEAEWLAAEAAGGSPPAAAAVPAAELTEAGGEPVAAAGGAQAEGHLAGEPVAADAVASA